MNINIMLSLMAIGSITLIPIGAYAETFTLKDNLGHPFATRLIATETGHNLAWHVPSSVDDYRLVKILGTNASVPSLLIWNTDGFEVDVTEQLDGGQCVIVKEFFDSGEANAIRLVCI